VHGRDLGAGQSSVYTEYHERILNVVDSLAVEKVSRSTRRSSRSAGSSTSAQRLAEGLRDSDVLAKALIDFLAAPVAAPVYTANGMEPGLPPTTSG
jgi:hypothetical protein